MRHLAAATFIIHTAAILAIAQQPQQQGQLDGSETLFTVLAAINAAGYDADLTSAANHPLRKQIREILAGKNLESLEELKRFVAAHHQKDSGAELSQYVSFALTLEGPPDFKFRVKPNEIPPDVNALIGFEFLLPKFYQEAKIGDLWRRSQPSYDQMIDLYHGPVSRALLEINAYLRNPTSGYLGRRFQIYVDLLGAPNQIQSRSYKDDYFMVVTPSPEPQLAEVRHGYLHYLLDPLALKFNDQLNRLKDIADYAQQSPALDAAYKSDFVLLATECLIKAVETRLTPASQRPGLVDQAMREGYVLTAAFADGLAGYEKQVDALRLHFPDMVRAIDLKREDQRVASIQFAKTAAVKMAKQSQRVPQPEPELTGAEKKLAVADELYRSRTLDQARQAYLNVLQETSQTPLHAKAYYGLARIAALQKDPELAEKLFQKTLELSPDTETKSWAYLYLGRLADAGQRREDAVNNYRAVLSIEGAPPTVRSAAEKGLQESFTQKK